MGRKELDSKSKSGMTGSEGTSPTKRNRNDRKAKRNNTYSSLITNYSVLRYWKAGNPLTPLRRTQWIKQGWMPPHPTLFIKKEIFDKYGLYDTRLKIASDYEMILRLFYNYNISSAYLPVTTYSMMIGGASNKSLGNILTKSKEDLLAMKMNDIPFPLFTLACKNLRKLPQFFVKGEQ